MKKQNDEENIVLIGMPAVGKSTIGILLAKKIGFDFLDTDIIIQTGEGKTLPEIIENIGVKKFLSLEQDYCLSVKCANYVIATGGSAVYSSKGMAHLAGNSTVVYLEIGLDYLKKRLSALDARGVIRGANQDIESLYLERIPLYNRYADMVIECGDLTPDKVLTQIMEHL
ncbi:MAG: shikimate kinase [Thermodesulfobacteriota bacterium]|nr:shikimate kinase [Thermodesulfobacteriota bacterium]